jgi:hypothetical protein
MMTDQDIKQLPRWLGMCDCGTTSVLMMVDLDLDTHMPLRFDTEVACSWCGKEWRTDPKGWPVDPNNT